MLMNVFFQVLIKFSIFTLNLLKRVSKGLIFKKNNLKEGFNSSKILSFKFTNISPNLLDQKLFSIYHAEKINK